MKVGIVGMGKMGILHSAILSALPDTSIVAVCEKKRLVQNIARAALPTMAVVEDVHELEGLGLDAVYVTTLPGAHHVIVREAYECKIARNVFVEKPLASTSQQAEEMCSWAQEAGGVAAVGFQKRFARPFQKARALLHEGLIGEPEAFRAYSYSSDFVDSEGDSASAASRGGALRDQGSHAIDLALWFFKDLTVVASTEDPQADAPSDLATVSFQTPTGARGTLGVSARMPDCRLPEIGISITGSRGELSVNDDRVSLLTEKGEEQWHRQDLDDKVCFLLGDPEYTREAVAFASAVRDGQPFEGADFNAGLRVELLIDAVATNAQSAAA